MIDDRTPPSGHRTAPPPDVAEEFLRSWARADVASAEPPGRNSPRRRLHRRRTVLVCALLVVALGVLGGGAFHLLSEDLGDNIERVPGVFAPLDPATRPAGGRSLTFLLAGTDSRSAGPTTGTGATAAGAGARSDVLMIARLNPDRTAAAVASIPRDSWVPIPGHGFNKINAAYALGGPPLLVETVENLTRIRVDHFAVIDFAGFQAMVDAVGGIDVGIGTATANDGVTFHAGVNHLDGRAALAYVRQRYGLVDGDLDRAQRQQNALRALVSRIAEQGLLSSPAATYELLDAASRSVSVDDTLGNGGLRALASDLHGLDAADLTFVRAPVGALGREGDQAVVHLDPARSEQLWTALRTDRVAAYAGTHPTDTLGPVTR